VDSVLKDRRRLRATAAVSLAAGAAVLIALVAAAFTGAGRATAQPAPRPATRIAAPAPPPPVVEIAAVGDMTFGLPGAPHPEGADAVLRRVAPLLAADLTLGNLETTLGAGGGSGCDPDADSCWRFRAPADTAAALRRAGFDAVNVANNHANDFGPAGQAETAAALDAARVPFTGRPGQITVVRAGGTRVALVGFAPYGFAQSLLDLPAATALVREAVRRAPLVVVLMHVGAEGRDAQHVRPGMETYLGEQRGDPLAFAHAVVDAGADLVLGSGPHVLRGLEWYRGRLIAHSLGNFSGYRTLNTTGSSGVSAILRVALHADGTFARGRLVPLRLDAPGTPAPDPDREALRLVGELGQADFGRNAAGLHADGRIRSSTGTRRAAGRPRTA
jgi:hypothetical protein